MTRTHPLNKIHLLTIIMMIDTVNTKVSGNDLLRWWGNLEEQWCKAFNEAILGKGPVATRPTKKELQTLFTTPAIRFAGPRAPYPNMSFELTNASGLTELVNVETLVLIHHQVESIANLSRLTQVKGLFIYDNQLASLSGIENMKILSTLHFHLNKVKSLRPLEKLTALTDVYAAHNQLEDLAGLTEQHAEVLEYFRVLPNKPLHQREVIRVENHLGIRCLQG